MGKITRTISRPLIFLIRAYRYCLSPLLGDCCRFHPSCSAYAIEALQKYAFFYSSYLILKRIIRCQPFCAGGYDPVPETKKYVSHNFN